LGALIGISGIRSEGLDLLREASYLHGEVREKVIEQAKGLLTSDDIARVAESFRDIASGDKLISNEGLGYAIQRAAVDPEWKKLATSKDTASTVTLAAAEIGASARRAVNKVFGGGASGLQEVDEIIRADRAASNANSRFLNGTARQVGTLYEAMSNLLGVPVEEVSDRFSFYAQVAGGHEDFVALERVLTSGDVQATDKLVTEMYDYLDRLAGSALIGEHETGWRRSVFEAFESAGFSRTKTDGHPAGPLFGDGEEAMFAAPESILGGITDNLTRIKRILRDQRFGAGGRGPLGETMKGVPINMPTAGDSGQSIWNIIEGEVREVAQGLTTLHNHMTAPLYDEVEKLGGKEILEELMSIYGDLSVFHRSMAEEAGLVGDVSILGYMPGVTSIRGTDLAEILEGELVQQNPAIKSIMSEVSARHRRPLRRVTRAEVNELVSRLNAHDEGGEVVDEILDMITELDPKLKDSEVTDPFIAQIVSSSKLIRGDELSTIVDNAVNIGGDTTGRRFIAGELVGWMDDMDPASIETVNFSGRMTDEELKTFFDDVTKVRGSRFHPPPSSYPAPKIAELKIAMEEKLREIPGVNNVTIKTTRGRGRSSSRFDSNKGDVEITLDSTVSNSFYKSLNQIQKRLGKRTKSSNAFEEFSKEIYTPGVSPKEVFKQLDTLIDRTFKAARKQKADPIWVREMLSTAIYHASQSLAIGGDLSGFMKFLKANGGAKKMEEVIAWHEVGHVYAHGTRAVGDEPRFLNDVLSRRERVEKIARNIYDIFYEPPLGGFKGSDKQQFKTIAAWRGIIEAEATQGGIAASNLGWKIPTNPSKLVQDTVELPRRVALIRDGKTGKIVHVPMSVAAKDMTLLSAGLGPTPGLAFSRTHLRGQAGPSHGIHHFLDPKMGDEAMAQHFKALGRERERLLALGHDPADGGFQVIAGDRRSVNSLVENAQQMEKQAGSLLSLMDSVHRLAKMGLTSTQLGFHVHNTLGAAPMLYANGANLPSIARGLMVTMGLLGDNPKGYKEKAKLIDNLLPGTRMGLMSGLDAPSAGRAALGAGLGAGAGALNAEEDQGMLGALTGALTGAAVGVRPKTGGMGAALGYTMGGLESPGFMMGGALSGALLGSKGLAPFRDAKLGAERRLFGADEILQIGDIQMSKKEYWEGFMHGGGFNTMVGEGVHDIRKETRALRDMIKKGEAHSESFGNHLNEFGQQSEIFARLWGYNTGLGMGLTPKQSMEKFVLGTFFDYGDLSPTAQNVMKRVNSFWTFGSKILSNSFDNFTKDPARFSAGLHGMLGLDSGGQIGDTPVSTDFVYGRPHAHWGNLSLNLGRLIPATEGLQAIGMFYDMLPTLPDPQADDIGALPPEVRSVSAGRAVERPGAFQLNVLANPVMTGLNKGVVNGIIEGLDQMAVIQRIAKDARFSETLDDIEADESYEDFVSNGFFGAFRAAGGKLMEAEKRIEYLKRLQARNEFAFQRAAERDPNPTYQRELALELKHMRDHFAREIKKLQRHQ
jgi:hypothetical protein